MSLVVILSAVALISGLAIFAMIRIFGISMLGLPHNAHMEKRKESADYFLTIPILILAGGTIVFGFLAKFIITNTADFIQSISSSVSGKLSFSMNVSSLWISGVIILSGLSVYIFQKILLKNKKERSYHTWDCGQSIDATMEYSATAFCAPIRFFFLTFIGRKKIMQSEPIIETNPWIRKYTFSLSIRSKWRNFLYSPIEKGLVLLARKLCIIQNGHIQYYILFLLFALTITLIFAL